MSDKKSIHVIDELTKESLTFEKNIIQNQEKSKKLAWIVASIFILYSLVLTGSFAFLLPLKETQPYVIRIDNNTGYTDIIPSLTDQSFTPDEALDRFWIAHYIELREKYVYETLQQDYERVQLYGSANVNRQYIGLFNADNAPYKLYGDGYAIEVKILSINLGVSEGETNTKTAIARAELTRVNLANNERVSKRIFATIAYDYKPNLSLALNHRTSNPLGFQILSYTVDTENR
ncbi:virB8 family protein [Gilliamella sp. CG13]|uniref:virB8 family protein n=1 Tax=Gilliamella sp. CG13 TaxID=3351502 RepID=UPI003987B302